MTNNPALEKALSEHLKDLEEIWYEEAEKTGKPMKDLCCDYESMVGIIRETCVQRDAIHARHDGTGELLEMLGNSLRWIHDEEGRKEIQSLLSRYPASQVKLQQGSNQQSE